MPTSGTDFCSSLFVFDFAGSAGCVFLLPDGWALGGGDAKKNHAINMNIIQVN